MNYANLYDNFMSYCKNTTPIERLKKRNPNDPRLNNDYIYIENHHIIPSHDNGPDETANMVSLLFEEHYLAHLIRYKAYKQRGDFTAVRFILNGTNKGPTHFSLNEDDTYSILKRIALYKNMVQKFRKEIGWHSEEGKKRISEARKNKIPAKCVKTGKIIEMSTTDPRYLSGEYVHHSKGMVSVTDFDGNKKYITTEEYSNNRNRYRANCADMSLEKNGRWSGYTDEFILDECCKIFKSYEDKNEFSFKNILSKLREKYKNIPKSFSKNRFKDKGGFKNALANKLEIELEELISLSNKKSKQHRKNLAKSNEGMKWYSNDLLKECKPSKEHPGNNWREGRTKYDN